MNKLHIAVLFGGHSSEYGVSLQSASAVISSMNRENFEPVMIGITQDGDWFYYTGTPEAIEKDEWRQSQWVKPAFFVPKYNRRELVVIDGNQINSIQIDAAFPVLHGKYGEDGTVQGVLSLCNIPIVGCGVLSSALCMDKDRAHRLVKEAGIRTPKAFVIRNNYDARQLERDALKIGFPLFVKPVKAGSSYGISKVFAISELKQAIAEALHYDDCVIVEETIYGFEVGCAVLGTKELTVGEVDEIELKDGFFDFKEKYNLITSKIHVPARIPKEKSEEIKYTAKQIYKALGCSVLARVDMFLTPNGEVVFNEVNTIPGFTSHSRYPGMMRQIGISFEDIITKAIEVALENE